MRISEVAYLGPEGTYSHDLALKLFRGKRVRFVGRDTVEDVCDYVSRKRSRMGVVPIVNSTGGVIYATVDALLDPSLSLSVAEEVALAVKLALLGHRGRQIEAVYSHFAPLKHCTGWLRSKFPRAARVPCDSTGAAARAAAQNPGAAAIASRSAASIYGLNVLRYPVPGQAKANVTHFFVIGRDCPASSRADKTSLDVRLANKPGALFGFLEPFAKLGLNLSRLISRPIPGRPTEFAFFVDVDSNMRNPTFRQGLREARKRSTSIRLLGSYPAGRSYRC